MWLESRRLDYEAKVRSRWEPQTVSNPIASTASQPTDRVTPTSPTSTEFNDNTAPAGIVTKPDGVQANNSSSSSTAPPQKAHRLDPATRLWAAGLRSDLHNPPSKSDNNSNNNKNSTRRTRSGVTN